VLHSGSQRELLAQLDAHTLDLVLANVAVLRDVPVVLPGCTSSLRASFDLLMDEAGIHPTIVAEVDDMAMLRLIARESDALTLVPPVVVRELLATRCGLPPPRAGAR